MGTFTERHPGLRRCQHRVGGIHLIDTQNGWSMTEDGASSGPGQRSSAGASRWTSATTIMTCITAVLALTTAGLGLFANRASDETSQAQAAASNLEEQVAGLTSNVNTLSTERDALQAQLNVAQDEIAKLETEVSAAAPVSSPTTAPVASAGAVRRSGSIDWSNETRLDFDSMDAQWSQFDDLASDEEFEVPRYAVGFSSYIELGKDSAYVKLKAGQLADFATCSVASGYIPGKSYVTIHIEDFRPGDQFCWRTNEGRFVALSLTSREENKFSTEVTIFEN